MHRHLVAVEVRIISSANQRMNSNGFALDQLRFKSLNGQSVQSRRTIEQHRMTFGHFIEMLFSDLRRLTLDHLFRAAHGVHVAKVFKTANDKRFSKSTSAIFFGNPHWCSFSSGPITITERPVLDAFAKGILAETSTLPEHVAQ